MKKWSALTNVQQENFRRGISYLLSDQWWIDAINDAPELVNADLRDAGYDPDTMTVDEKVQALNSLPDDESGDA